MQTTITMWITLVVCSALALLTGHTAAQPKYCQLDKDSGSCYEMSTKYYYNTFTKTCRSFMYRGCDGNDNRFDTEEMCQQICGNSKQVSPPQDTCSLPPNKGPCMLSIHTFYYNALTKSCIKFTYGGCGGNRNRFDTQQECEQRCQETDTCSLPPESGPCRRHIHKYFYNSTTGTCEDFVYGGCKGNDNRFDTFNECETKCIAKPPPFYQGPPAYLQWMLERA